MPNSRLVSVTNLSGTNIYNGLNQLVSMTDCCGNTTLYDYKNTRRRKEGYLRDGIDRS